jgi:hypothetical protein
MNAGFFRPGLETGDERRQDSGSAKARTLRLATFTPENRSMLGWVMAVSAAMAALVPAIVYFAVSFTCYNCRGYGTRPAADAAPGALSGAKFCSAQCFKR